MCRVAESSRNSSFRWWRFRTWEVALHGWWRKCVFFLSVACGAAFLCGKVARIVLVSVLGESVDEGILRRAVALDPANPELHHRLGMILCDSLTPASRTEGLEQLRRSTELNPYTARFWSDLAWACELAGDTACTTRGEEQAVRLSPMAPHGHWVAANTFLRLGRRDAAIAEFRRLLELDPSYGPATFHVCLGTLGDPQLIRDRVLPFGKDPRVKLAYVNFLSANDLADIAHQVWVQTVVAGAPFPLDLATPYIERLIALGRVAEAQGAWRDLEKLGVVSTPLPEESDNLLFNGDFEKTPLNAGFDWRYRSGPYIALDFSDEAAHTGKHCLRIDFTVSRNDDSLPVYQLVPVASNEAYFLSAFVRSRDITSDSGPRLQVLDQIDPDGLKVVSESTVGTTPWHSILLRFCTGQDTRLVQLSVIRARARNFPTEIAGSFWLDTVSLKAIGPASENGCVVSVR
jgi:tetratricopeptide (TPR) repeat protein